MILSDTKTSHSGWYGVHSRLGRQVLVLCAGCGWLAAAATIANSQDRKQRAAETALTFPPELPNGQSVITVSSAELLQPTASIRADVGIAKTPPTIDFLYYPGQNYLGKPWSNWGDGLAIQGKYYSAVGDHLAPEGHAFVFQYDPNPKELKLLCDVSRTLQDVPGYKPGKVHSRIDQGSDGWLYFATHRGSTTVTTDAHHYRGDWILRCHPETGASEVVAWGPVAKHCIPCSVLDPERLIFYGGTASGVGKDVRFFAYNVKQRKMLFEGPDGPPRYMIFSRSSGRVYYVPGNDEGQLVRFDPATAKAPQTIDTVIGLRAATEETANGIVYTVGKGSKDSVSKLYAFNTQTETATELGPAAVGAANYITSIDVDASGRYLYYVPGAHGDAPEDGTPIVQFDTRTKKAKVLAFLHPYFQKLIGATPVGTFSTAIDPAGDKLYVTWNVNRAGRAWDCCALSVVHIPPSERP